MWPFNNKEEKCLEIEKLKSDLKKLDDQNKELRVRISELHNWQNAVLTKELKPLYKVRLQQDRWPSSSSAATIKHESKDDLFPVYDEFQCHYLEDANKYISIPYGFDKGNAISVDKVEIEFEEYLGYDRHAGSQYKMTKKEVNQYTWNCIKAIVDNKIVVLDKADFEVVDV